MKKFKILTIAILVVMLVSLMPIVVNAETETYTATSTINGIEVSWEYSLNDAGEIVDLRCTSKDLLADQDFTIPSTIDGKTVVELGVDCFRKCRMTGVTIPDTVKKIGHNAFGDDYNLSRVDLGRIESISDDVFKGCTSLHSLTIPSTLKKAGITASINNKNVTNITFEDGLTIIPANLCANTGITSVDLPDSVRTLGYNAFENCTELTSVNLNKLESISFDVFKGCTSLTSIVIPKTLKDGSVSPSLNCASITSITFEDGLTTIPAELCANTGVSKIVIPDSVKSVGYNAFENCKNLSSVDLGKIESISFDAFKNCPKLKSIVIPNTLVDGCVTSCGVFTGTTDLTSVTFEDGLKEIPSCILATCSEITEVTIPDSVEKINFEAFLGTSITEINIPNTVKEIDYYAFKDCKNLKKITILDNCEHIGWYTIYPNTDNVFNNHDEDLTIYCYRGSKIAQYAIDTNIKYVYLDRETTEEEPAREEPKQEEKETPKAQDKTNTTKDTTTAKTNRLPQTGVGIGLSLAIVAAFGLAGYSIIKYKKL